MKWFIGVLFLVVAVVGDPQCDPPRRFKAGYLSAGLFKVRGSEHTYVVSGDVAVDFSGNRIRITYNAYGHEGQVLILYNENTMYFRAGKSCYKHKIPEDLKDTLEEMKLGKNTQLLRRGRPADFCQRVNVYGSQHHQKNTTVHSLISLTDSCIPMSVTFKVEGNSGGFNYIGFGQINLFDVDLVVSKKTFEVPSDCPTDLVASPDISALKFKLFR